jgi:hypothetical protein
MFKPQHMGALLTALAVSCVSLAAAQTKGPATSAAPADGKSALSGDDRKFVDELTVPREADPAATELAADPVAPYVPPPPPNERNDPLAPSAESGRAKFLDIDLTVDGNGVKLGGRVSGNKGVSGAWLSVQVRGDGMTLDGRLQGNDGPPRDLKLNLGLLPGWARTAARIWLMVP